MGSFDNLGFLPRLPLVVNYLGGVAEIRRGTTKPEAIVKEREV